ncbi:heparan-alpha-glucosaminide N-acetyltransferase domain-containing protein [Cellulomonas sp. Y8]|uniref:heparan-alpha-glucosaminide N-acetyltransferase domain-containing protein n=1 Tax=Cellulomonas sp. Y8 TaxID=2591145 RepID=UPI003D71E605
MSSTTVAPAPPAPASAPPARGLLRRWRDLGRPPRLMGLDVARALAVIGMVAAHVAHVPPLAWTRPGTWGGIVAGHPSILFALVAGVAVALSTGREEPPAGDRLRAARLALTGRGLVVLAIGLALELLGSPVVVILAVYGVLFVALTPVLGWSRRRLVVAAVAIALAGPAVLAGVSALALGGGSGAGVQLLLQGAYPATTWLPLLLAGMALGRCRLGTTRVALRLLAGGVLLAVLGHGAGAALDPGDATASSGAGSSGVAIDAQGNVLEPGSGDAPQVDQDAASSSGDVEVPGYPERLRESVDVRRLADVALSSAPHSGGTLEIVGAGGVATAVLGGCLLLSRPLRPALVPLAAVGSMPLTCYTLHVVSVAVLIEPGGLLVHRLTEDGAPGGSGLFTWSVAVALVGCTAWALTLGRGPLERLTGRAARALAR